MTIRQQWLLVGSVVGVLAAGMVGATHFLGDELFPVAAGSPAPPFSATMIDSLSPPRTRSLRDYRGQVVVLNIWATWCAPCRVEMPSLQRLHAAYASQGLKVVAVSVDDPGERQVQQIRQFRREFGLTFEVLHEGTGTIERIYQTTGVPETFVIGKDGTIRKKVIGAAAWDSDANRSLIARLLVE
ncbi:MAG: peroxiredoxin family protein [Gemmatimonadaceae bacterium]